MLAHKLGDDPLVLRDRATQSPEIREQYELPGLSDKTPYRTVEILGHHGERIVRELQDRILKLLDVPITDALIDRTSIMHYGNMAELAKYG